MQRNRVQILDSVAAYARKMELPLLLGRRVRRYFRERRTNALNEAEILLELSPSLRSEVCAFVVSDGLLSGVFLFRRLTSVFWPKLLPLLKPCPVARGA